MTSRNDFMGMWICQNRKLYGIIIAQSAIRAVAFGPSCFAGIIQGGRHMNTVKYTDSADFHCLEDLQERALDISLIHMGKETCKPYHAFSGVRDEYIIHFVLSGSGFYSANGNTWPLSAGQMFLIYPDTPIVYCADKNTPWTYAWVGFNGLGVSTVLNECGFSKSQLILPVPDTDEYIKCFDELFNHVSLSFSNRLYRQSLLLRLMAVLIDYHTHTLLNSSEEKTAYGNNTYVDMAIDYINEMYMRDITVSDIADKIGITRARLNSAFQKELNLSVQRFLIDFRMHKAANLLVNTTMSVKEIAGHVGYSDQLVFSKAFKKKFEMSPKNYRTYKAELELRDKRP